MKKPGLAEVPGYRPLSIEKDLRCLPPSRRDHLYNKLRMNQNYITRKKSISDKIPRAQVPGSEQITRYRVFYRVGTSISLIYKNCYIFIRMSWSCGDSDTLTKFIIFYNKYKTSLGFNIMKWTRELLPTTVSTEILLI